MVRLIRPPISSAMALMCVGNSPAMLSARFLPTAVGYSRVGIASAANLFASLIGSSSLRPISGGPIIFRWLMTMVWYLLLALVSLRMKASCSSAAVWYTRRWSPVAVVPVRTWARYQQAWVRPVRPSRQTIVSGPQFLDAPRSTQASSFPLYRHLSSILSALWKAVGIPSGPIVRAPILRGSSKEQMSTSAVGLT